MRATYVLEYVLAQAFLAILRVMPLDMASWLMGNIARAVGPYVPRSTLALAQIRQHLPPHPDRESAILLRDMWENMGRILGEYPHLHRDMMADRIAIVGREHLPSSAPVLFISGHVGNWEIIPRGLGLYSSAVHVIYRPPNNPLAKRIIDRIRSRYSLGHYGKGREGARGVLEAFSAGENVLMLIDQKDNTGSLLRFLGSPAMTMTSAAKLALKHGVPVVPVLVERTGGSHFTLHVQPALIAPSEGSAEDNITAYMQLMNDRLSQWITAHPAQWFWLHRRWPKNT